MRSILAAACLVLATGRAAAAHQLDQYLQAARLDITGAHVGVELLLTPGAALAAAVLTSIDGDGDGIVSAREGDAYVAQVARSLVLTVDGRDVPLRVSRAVFPGWADVRAGVGSIRVDAGADRALEPGRHRIAFENRHRPEGSVYLVNALKPASGRIAIESQRRDPGQARIEIDVRLTDRSGRIAWSASAAALFACWFALRRHRPAPSPRT